MTHAAASLSFQLFGMRGPKQNNKHINTTVQWHPKHWFSFAQLRYVYSSILTITAYSNGLIGAFRILSPSTLHCWHTSRQSDEDQQFWAFRGRMGKLHSRRWISGSLLVPQRRQHQLYYSHLVSRWLGIGFLPFLRDCEYAVFLRNTQSYLQC